MIEYKYLYGFCSWRKYNEHGKLLYWKDSSGFEKCYKYDEYDNIILL
jgi:hypothetical protein